MTETQMVMDAGYDPDSDEGQNMAASLEAEEQRAYEESQQPDIVPCPRCGREMWETANLCDGCKKKSEYRPWEETNETEVEYLGRRFIEVSARADGLEHILRKHGYFECDAPDCGCGGWHRPGWFYSEVDNRRIFVFRIDGRMDERTRAEVEYAKRTGKRVTYLEAVK